MSPSLPMVILTVILLEHFACICIYICRYAVHTLLLCMCVFVWGMYVTMGVCMHVCACGWKPEVSAGCHLSSLSTSLLGTKSLTEPGAHQFGLSGQPVSSRHPLSLPLQHWNYRRELHLVFTWVLGIRTQIGTLTQDALDHPSMPFVSPLLWVFIACHYYLDT